MTKYLLFLFIFAGSAFSRAQVVTTVSQLVDGCCWYSGVDAIGAQSFTITQAGYITEIRFHTLGAEGSTTFELREGQNLAGPLLFSTVINIGAAGWISVPIPNIPVCEGVYCFTQSGYQWGALNTTDPYAGGMAYYSGGWTAIQDQAFEVDQTINAEPTSPTIFPNIFLCPGQNMTPTSFTITDETPASVTVSATSSNTSVVPAGNIVLGGSGSSRTIGLSGPVTTSGTTTITVTLSDGNCTNTYTFNIQVYALPTVSAGSDQTICVGNSVTLAGSGTAVSYAWDNGVTNGVSFTPTVGAVTYTVTGADVNGCQSTDAAVVTVNPLPVVNFAAVPDFCIDGASYTLTEGTPAGGIYSGPGVSGSSFVPSTAGVGSHAVNYTYTDGNGCVASAGQSIIVNNLPAVTFSPLADVCENIAPFTLTGGSPAGGTYTGTGVSGSSFDPSIAGPGSHVLTYTYTDGVTSCTNSATSTIVVLVSPTVTAGSSATTVCSGDLVTLNGTGAFSYTWDNGVTDGVAFAPPVGTTTYTVTGTATNGCQNTSSVNITAQALPTVSFAAVPSFCTDGTAYTLVEGTPAGGTYSGTGISGGIFDPVSAGAGSHAATYTYTDVNSCTAAAGQTITVNNLPTVSFTPPAAICLNAAPVTLTGGTPAGGTYSGTGVSAGLFDPAVAGLGTHSITYTYTDGVTTCTNAASQNILVYAAPSVTASSTANPVCVGTSVTLTGGGAITYTWDNGVTDGIAFIPPVGSTVYTVTGTDVNGCTNTNQVTLVVNSLPAVNGGPDQTLCEGVSTTLSGTGAITYSWNNGITDGTAFIPPTGITNYMVTGTDGNGCENADTVVLTVNLLPVLTTSSDQFFCAGDTVLLTAGGATSFDWNTGAGSGTSFSISPTLSTNVQVAGTTNGCTTVNTIILTLDDPAQISAGNDAAVCIGFVTYLQASGGVSYLWNGPGVTNETDPNYGFIADTTSYYFVAVTTANGCVYEDSVLITALSDPSCTIEPLTSFSPNGDAVNETWKIQGIEGFPNNHVTILNRWGDIVFDELNYDNETVLWTGTLKTGSEAPAGTYYFIIEITDGPSATGWIQLLK
ncbi:MAG: gliding motility-associated C-terminal domain-containing protein [Bacteroidetes bacterium]|nr:gliding motility-associated C-terminal domain-containing protein [Bacteroidota bacterium]